jgi:hypothetical protein
MSLRSLFFVPIMLAVALSAATLRGEAASESVACDSQVTGQTVVTSPPAAQPAPAATWWANSAVGKFCRSVARDTKRANCWPEPFPRADREAERTPFVIMVANGWRRQNTLGDHHFDAETGKLNRAGQLKVRAILLQGLPQHRFLSVYRAERDSETAARVASVEQYAAQTIRDGAMPQILETDTPAPGWSARWVEVVDRKYESSMPDPRLPKAESDQDSTSSQ